VLAPDGKVIYEETGEVHLLALRRAILANLPDMGYAGNAADWASKWSFLLGAGWPWTL
jgi:hypothetical protein